MAEQGPEPGTSRSKSNTRTNVQYISYVLCKCVCVCFFNVKSPPDLLPAIRLQPGEAFLNPQSRCEFCHPCITAICEGT